MFNRLFLEKLMKKILPVSIMLIVLFSISGRDVSAYTESHDPSIEFVLLEENNDIPEQGVNTEIVESVTTEFFGDQRYFWYFEWEAWEHVKTLATLLSAGNYKL